MVKRNLLGKLLLGQSLVSRTTHTTSTSISNRQSYTNRWNSFGTRPEWHVHPELLELLERLATEFSSDVIIFSLSAGEGGLNSA